MVSSSGTGTVTLAGDVAFTRGQTGNRLHAVAGRSHESVRRRARSTTGNESQVHVAAGELNPVRTNKHDPLVKRVARSDDSISAAGPEILRCTVRLSTLSSIRYIGK